MTVLLPYAMRKRGGQLLHQQCWLWGQDIRHKEGNVLLQEGFVRRRPPEGLEGSSQYTLRLSESVHVRLWGFGFFYGGSEGIYLNRYAFTPLSARLSDDVWTPKPFARLCLSQNFIAIAEAVRWIAHFEKTVQTGMGIDYRNRCLLGWSNRALAPRDFLDAWHRFADELNAFAKQQVPDSEQSEVRPFFALLPRSRSVCGDSGSTTQFPSHPGITQLGTPLYQRLNVLS
jgi:hypothetical protein